MSWNKGVNSYGFGGTHEMDNEVKGEVGKHLSFGALGSYTHTAILSNQKPINHKQVNK